MFLDKTELIIKITISKIYFFLRKIVSNLLKHTLTNFKKMTLYLQKKSTTFNGIQKHLS